MFGGLYMDKFLCKGKYGYVVVWGVYGGSSLIGCKLILVLVINFNCNGLNSDELEIFVYEFGYVLYGILFNICFLF